MRPIVPSRARARAGQRRRARRQWCARRVSTESPPSVNPYAPTEALAHGDAPANDHAQPAGRRAAGRFAAIVVAILSYPLAGAGLYVLGRRSAVVWMIAGLCTYALVIAS